MKNSTDINRELSQAFDEGKIFDASEKDLDRYLCYLCSGQVKYEMANRCQVINTVKTFRFIKKLEKTSKFLTIVIIILSMLAIGLSVYSIYQSHKTTNKIEQLINLQKQQVDFLLKKEGT